MQPDHSFPDTSSSTTSPLPQDPLPHCFLFRTWIYVGVPFCYYFITLEYWIRQNIGLHGYRGLLSIIKSYDWKTILLKAQIIFLKFYLKFKIKQSSSFICTSDCRAWSGSLECVLKTGSLWIYRSPPWCLAAHCRWAPCKVKILWLHFDKSLIQNEHMQSTATGTYR